MPRAYVGLSDVTSDFGPTLCKKDVVSPPSLVMSVVVKMPQSQKMIVSQTNNSAHYIIK